MKYIQCKLFQDYAPSSGSVQTAYIPEEFAVKNKMLKIRNERTNEWSYDWQVVEVYPTTCVDVPLHVAGNVRRHRERTGDNFPKNSKKFPKKS